MHEFARTIGYVYLASGALLVAFPEAARNIMRAREELAHLSPGALRLLGAWAFFMGGLLVAVTTKPAREIRAAEFVSPERRQAA